jgi:hypothetical protein
MAQKQEKWMGRMSKSQKIGCSFFTNVVLMSSSPVIILLTLSDALAEFDFFIIEVRVRMETSCSCAQRARYA